MWSNTRFYNTIFTPSTSTAAVGLDDERLRKQAPSIYATEPWEKMTDKYLFVPTSLIIEKMRLGGYVPVRAMQSRCRTPGKGAYTRHMVVFRDSRRIQHAGEVMPEILLVNSHDGTCSWQLHAGIFRFICGNGLIVADSTIACLRFRHSKRLADEIIEGTDTLIRELPRVEEKIDAFKSITLSTAEQAILAEEALSLRYDTTQHVPITPAQALTVRRREDDKPTLWHTYNRLEENLVKGGLDGRSSTNRQQKTRAVNGVSQKVDLEKALFRLTEKMAELKGR